MKIFTAVLFSLAIFCHGAFAAPGDKAKQREQQEEQQKMAQLQQLLLKVSQGNNTTTKTLSPPANDNSPLASEMNQQQASAAGQTTQMQAPNAGLTTAPYAMAQNNDAISGSNQNGAQSTAPNAVATEQTTVANASASAAEITQPNLYDQAFSNVVNQLLPMTPEQIAKLHEVFLESQSVAATPPGIPPKPTSTSLIVNLSPQATPPIIRLGAGYITSLVFMDSTGQPWPIAAYSIGDPTSFNIQWDHKGNTLLMQSSTFYKRSNLAVILRDLNTPVMLTLISGQNAVDYRVDLRVPGVGPNAVFMQNGIPDAANPVLLDVLNGVPPKGSRELKVGGGDCQAWLLNKKLYLRTNLDVISPGWQAVMSSIDGTHAYQMQPAPVILVLQHGKDKVLTLTLEGLE